MNVAIIGAGAGGIAMGLQLADAGYEFTIFDRADGFGGTWRHNTFPGAARMRRKAWCRSAFS